MVGWASVNGKAATRSSEGSVACHTPTLAALILPRKSIHISCRGTISALILGFFFLPGLDVNTWMPDVLQAGMLEENVKGVSLYTDFQLVTCFYRHFSLLPSIVFIFSAASSAQLLFHTPSPALHVIGRF